MSIEQEKIYIIAEIMDNMNELNIKPEKKEEMKNLLITIFSTFCDFCCGYGHRFDRCSTKRKLRNILRRIGKIELWKMIKIHYNVDEQDN